MFCQHCAWDVGELTTCNHPSTGCGRGFCDECAGEHLCTASAWAAELQTREAAVDAGVVERLLEAARVDDEKREFCEECATYYHASSEEEQEEEEND
jgi:hypothetical protein